MHWQIFFWFFIRTHPVKNQNAHIDQLSVPIYGWGFKERCFLPRVCLRPIWMNTLHIVQHNVNVKMQWTRAIQRHGDNLETKLQHNSLENTLDLLLSLFLKKGCTTLSVPWNTQEKGRLDFLPGYVSVFFSTRWLNIYWFSPASRKSTAPMQLLLSFIFL